MRLQQYTRRVILETKHNLVTILLLLSCVCALIKADSTYADEKPFRIGVVYGFSGAAHKWSEYGRKGVQLAVEEINGKGGVKGRPIEIIFEDSRTNPMNSVSAYRKLVTIDRVNAMAGNVWSILTNPLIPLTRQDKVVLIAPTVMDASIETQSDYFFSMGPRIESIRTPTTKFFDIHPEVKRVAFLCWDDAWGQANLKIWKEVAESKGISIVETLCQNDYNNSFRSEITRIKSKKPQAIFVGMYPERVAARTQELGLKATIYTTSTVLEALDSSEHNDSLFENIYFAYWPPNEEFTKAYRTKYGENPILEAHNHYEVIRSIAKALSKDPENLREAITKVHYEGVAGRIDFRSSPYVNYSDGVLMNIKNRKPQIVP